jgi:glyoxylase-like metal-dependent hydrolase (beta-lactamase superfamily II)
MKASAAAAPESPFITIRNAAATAKIAVHKLRGNLSVLEGSGGNITVLTGRDGKVLLDAGISRPQVEDALAGVSDDPVRHLINSHWHFDHTDGNEWLHSIGAGITAHENTRKQNVIAVADTFWNGVYPFIDYSTGGNIDGMIRVAEANVANTDDETIVIPGHGPIGNKSQLIAFRDMLVAIREKVGNLKKQGKSLDEAVASKPTAEHDEKWGGFVINGDFFTRFVYAGV